MSGEETAVLEVICPLCGGKREVEAPVRVLEAMSRPNSPHIQTLWPEATPSQREAVLTGTCDPCWDRLLGDDDE